MKYDVIVIGAGAAGLAAARTLSGHGKRVCVVEARPRIGGRISTIHLPDLPVPIELGAEFIHGADSSTFSIVDAAALTTVTLPDDHVWTQNGQDTSIGDFWQRIGKVTTKIGTLRKDLPFSEFLRRRKDLDARTRELARTFVEGYHAAHAERMSTLALRTADSEQEDQGQKQFRILNGQDSLIEWLRSGLDPERVALRLGTIVTDVAWGPNAVAVQCHGVSSPTRALTLRARTAVITIPIGVWKAANEQEGAIRFDPPLPDKERAAAALETGHVVKIAFRFRERFWETGGASPNFLHSSDRFVPTWWTTAPVRSPVLTAWAGGHAADALLAEGREAMVDRVLDALCRAWKQPRRRIDDLLAGSFTHDWQSDPFSRGAYSYAGVGGSGAHDALAKPVRGTLFFAGEATSSDQTGTVTGAIDSGRRAAREVLRG